MLSSATLTYNSTWWLSACAWHVSVLFKRTFPYLIPDGWLYLSISIYHLSRVISLWESVVHCQGRFMCSFICSAFRLEQGLWRGVPSMRGHAFSKNPKISKWTPKQNVLKQTTKKHKVPWEKTLGNCTKFKVLLFHWHPCSKTIPKFPPFALSWLGELNIEFRKPKQNREVYKISLTKATLPNFSLSYIN